MRHLDDAMGRRGGQGHLILATGDGGLCFGTLSFPELADRFLSIGWHVTVLSWSKCLNFRYRDLARRFPSLLTVLLLDAHRHLLSFSAGALPGAVSPPGYTQQQQHRPVPGPRSRPHGQPIQRTFLLPDFPPILLDFPIVFLVQSYGLSFSL